MNGSEIIRTENEDKENFSFAKIFTFEDLDCERKMGFGPTTLSLGSRLIGTTT